MFSRLLDKAKSLRGPVNSQIFPAHLVERSYNEQGPLADTVGSFEQAGAELLWVDNAANPPVPCLLFAGRSLCYRVLIYAHCNAEDMWNGHQLLCALRDALPCHVIAMEYPVPVSLSISVRGCVNCCPHD